MSEVPDPGEDAEELPVESTVGELGRLQLG